MIPGARSASFTKPRSPGRCEHRGIAPVYGLGHFDNGRPFYAMRFIGGTRLKDAIDKFHATIPSAQDPDDRSLELRRLLARFVDVCNTVAYATVAAYFIATSNPRTSLSTSMVRHW